MIRVKVVGKWSDKVRSVKRAWDCLMQWDAHITSLVRVLSVCVNAAEISTETELATVGGGRPRRNSCSRERAAGLGVGLAGAVGAEISPVAVGVSDGRLVGVELALLVATILAGEGSIGGVDCVTVSGVPEALPGGAEMFSTSARA
jgi:hypothetical protein